MTTLEAPVLRFLCSNKVYDKAKGFKEPSGLTIDPDTGALWSVDDEAARLFRLSRKGRVKKKRKLPKTSKDLEGITFLRDGTLAVAQESGNRVLLINGSNHREILRGNLRGMAGYKCYRKMLDAGPKTRGLEGIAADPDQGRLYVIKEGRPRLLLEISADMRRIVSGRKLKKKHGFRDPTPEKPVGNKKLDVAGLAFDPARNALWIVSDTGRCVFLYDLQTRKAAGVPLLWESKGKTRRVRKAEGIALDPGGDILHVITDNGKKSRLLRYEILAPKPPAGA